MTPSLLIFHVLAKHSAWRWAIGILLISLLTTLALWPTGLEHQLAQRLYQPDARWAWEVRQYSAYPALLLTVLALALLLTPWRRRYPELRRLAVIWLFTVVIGAGLLNQVVLNELVERPRPRESVLALAAGAEAALSGKSFPSGHAAVGFVFVAPFFLWWQQRRRKWAIAALAVGLSAGFMVGYARMVLGAHFLTDVLWAGTVCLLAAIGATALYKGGRDVPIWLTGGFLALVVASMVLFNSFKLTLQWQALTPMAELRLDTPCESLHVVTDPDVTTPRVTLRLKGYGAPLSTLTLQQKGHTVFLQRWRGIYHGLACKELSVLAAPSTKVLQTP